MRSAPEYDLLNILQCSFMDTLNACDLSQNTLKHIIRVLFDFTKYEPSRNNRISEESKLSANLAKGKSIVKSSPSHLKCTKTTPAKVMKSTSQHLTEKATSSTIKPTHIQSPPDIESEVMEVADVPAPTIVEDVSPCITGIPSATDKCDSVNVSTDIVTDISVPSAKRKKRSKTAKSMDNGSVRSAAAKRVAPDPADQHNAWDEVASVLYSYIKENNFAMWFKATPGEVGIKCTAPSIVKCQRCIHAMLCAPVTNCSDVKCAKKHRDGLFPHNVADLNLNDLHEFDVKQSCRAYFKNMFSRDIMPSVIYCAMHGTETKVPRRGIEAVKVLGAFVSNVLHDQV